MSTFTMDLFCFICLSWVSFVSLGAFFTFFHARVFSFCLSHPGFFLTTLSPLRLLPRPQAHLLPPAGRQLSPADALSAGHAADDSGTPHHAPHPGPASLHAAPRHDPASRPCTWPDPTRSHASTAAYAGPDATCPACKCLVLPGSCINSENVGLEGQQ